MIINHFLPLFSKNRLYLIINMIDKFIPIPIQLPILHTETICINRDFGILLLMV